MNIEEEIKRYELSEEDFDKHADKIFKMISMNATKSDNPKFIMVGGQAGSGKTGLVTKKNKELKEGAIIIDQDEIRATFPEELYSQILKDHDDREEYLILKPYVLKMRQALVDKARDNGYNVIMESAMQAVDSFIPQIQSFKNAGYETNLAVISVPKIDCFLSTLNRYCFYLNRDGICRRNTRMASEMTVKLSNNLTKLEESGLFDNIEVFIRGNTQDELPRIIYSKKDNTKETTLQAFNRGEKLSLGNARKTFMARAAAIRKVLNEHNDTEKIEQLEKLEEEFKASEDRGDYGE